MTFKWHSNKLNDFQLPFCCSYIFIVLILNMARYRMKTAPLFLIHVHLELLLIETSLEFHKDKLRDKFPMLESSIYCLITSSAILIQHQYDMITERKVKWDRKRKNGIMLGITSPLLTCYSDTSKRLLLYINVIPVCCPINNN